MAPRRPGQIDQFHMIVDGKRKKIPFGTLPGTEAAGNVTMFEGDPTPPGTSRHVAYPTPCRTGYAASVVMQPVRTAYTAVQRAQQLAGTTAGWMGTRVQLLYAVWVAGCGAAARV